MLTLVPQVRVHLLDANLGSGAWCLVPQVRVHRLDANLGREGPSLVPQVRPSFGLTWA